MHNHLEHRPARLTSSRGARLIPVSLCLQNRKLQLKAEHSGAEAVHSSQGHTEPLSPEAKALIERSDCMFIATQLRSEDLEGADSRTLGPDVSHRGGPPGFVKVLDSNRLQWPDYIGAAAWLSVAQMPCH